MSKNCLRARQLGLSLATIAGAASAQGFQAPVAYPVSTPPTNLHAADLNGDGICDIFVTAAADCRTMVGQPGGGFVLGPISPIPSGGSRTVLADIDGDGALDLIRNTSLAGQQVALHKGNGSGSFGGAPFAVLGNIAHSGGTNPAVADLNADGIPDIAQSTFISTFASNLLNSWLGLGAGAFDSGHTTIVSPASLQPTPRSIAVSDFNDDGAVDLALQVALPLFGSSITFFSGLADGTFATTGTQLTCPDGFGHLEVGDLTGDLREDVLFGGRVPASTAPGSVGVATGTAAGPFGSYVAIASFPTGAGFGTSIGGMAIGDLTADGRPDALFTATTSTTLQPTLHLAAGSASGLVLPATQTSLNANGFVASDLVVGDFDLDGRNDVIAGMNNATIVELRGTAPTAPTSNVSLYGAGTPGCRGTLSASTNSTPQVGNANYGYFFTNAPSSSLGLFVATDSQDFAGSDPFGLNITLHVDFFSAVEIYAADILFDASGQGFVPSPIPPLSGFAGLQYYVQALGLERAADGFTCNNASFGLSASRALHVTVAP